MKRILALLLALLMCLSMFAGCKKNEPAPTDPTDAPEVTEAVPDENLEKAIEYLRVFYKDAATETSTDFERIGTVRVAGQAYEIVWSVDEAAAKYIKAVKNDDGSWTIDFDEEAIKEITDPLPYVLTATITGTDGRELSLTWDMVLPAYVDPIAILKAAYALKEGETMEGIWTLTGKVISIDTPYSESYKNITVTIEIEGAPDMPIMCYRLKGEGVEDLFVDDVITVTGTIKNYKGTIEFDQGCIMEACIPGPRVPVEAPDDPAEIVKQAYALKEGKSLPYEATLTGTVTKIDYAHKPGADNMSVTISVYGKSFYCYYLTGSASQLSQITLNDLITVKGTIKNYYGKIEFDHPTLVGLTNRAAPLGETDPVKIMADAKKLGNKQELYLSTMTGIVSEIKSAYSSQYGNVSFMLLIDGLEDEEIYCFRVVGDYASKVKVGDRVQVTGNIVNWNGSLQYNQGSTMKLIEAGVGLPGSDVSYGATPVETPVAGEEYVLAVVQKNVAGDPTLFFNGGIANSYYLDTTQNGAKAVAVTLVETTGGYYLSFKDASGATKYISATQETKANSSGTMQTYTNLAISDKPSTVFVIDASKAIKTTLGGEDWFIGTYNEYTTLSIRKWEKLAEDMPAYLCTVVKTSGPATIDELVKQLEVDYAAGANGIENALPETVTVRKDTVKVVWTVDPADSPAVKLVDGKLILTPQDSGAVTYKLIGTITLGEETKAVTYDLSVPKKSYAPTEGVAYKLELHQRNLSVWANYYFDGTIQSDRYLNTTGKFEDGVDVSIVKAGEGFKLTFKDDKGTVQYINTIENSEGKSAFTFGTDAASATVYTFNATYGTIETTVGENEYYIGTWSTYKTMSASGTYNIKSIADIDNVQFVGRLVTEATPFPAKPDGTAEGALATLKSQYKTFRDGIALIDSVDDNNDSYAVTWEITPKSETAEIVNGKLIYKPGNDETEISLKATVTNKDDAADTASHTFTVTIPKKALVTLKPEMVSEPQMGQTYKLAIAQNNLGATLFFNAKMSGYYFATTENIAEAVDVTPVAATGEAMYLTFVNAEGKTQYINVIQNGTHTNIVMGDEAVSAFTYDKALGILKTTVGGEEYYLGTYDKKDTISASKLSYINAENVDASQFPARFYTIKEVSGAASAEELEAQLKQDYKIYNGETADLSDSVSVRDTEAQITWSIETDPANSPAAKIENKRIVTQQQESGAVSYKLYATITVNGEAVKILVDEGTVSAKPNENYIPAETADALTAGDKIVIYNAANSKALGAEETTDGKKIVGADVTVTEGLLDKTSAAAVALTVGVKDGYYFFVNENGEYLTSGATGNSMTYEAEPNDYSLWTIQAIADDSGAHTGYHIINANAAYNNGPKNQALEYYSGFTTYGVKDTDIYLMAIYKIGTTTAPGYGTPATAANALADLLTPDLKVNIPSESTNGTAGTTLPSTHTYKGTEFTVTWDIKSATEGSAELNGYALILNQLQEDAEVVLTATVTNGDDTASTDLDSIVIPKAGTPTVTMEQLKTKVTELYNDGADGKTNALPITVSVDGYAGEGNIAWTIATDLSYTDLEVGSDNRITAKKLNVVLPYTLTGTITMGEETADVTLQGSLPVSLPAPEDVVTSVDADSAYYMAMIPQNNNTYYSTGTLDGNYGKTDTESSAAARFEVETVTDGFKLKVAGTANYVYLAKSTNADGSKTYINFKIGSEEAPAVFKLDTTRRNALVTTFEESEYWLGNYGSYTSINTVKESHANENYLVYLVPAEAVAYDAEDAFNKLKDIYTAENALNLDGTVNTLKASPYTFQGTDYNLTWSVTAGTEAATLEDGNKLTLNKQDALVAVELTLVVTAVDDEANTYTGTINIDVPAKVTEPTTSTIKEALAGAKDTEFTVKGVVTFIDGRNVYIQDATGGICLYFDAAPTGISLGDTVIGTGSKTTYNGLPELGGATLVKSSGMTLSAKETTLANLTNADICTYVKIENLLVENISGTTVTVKQGDKTIDIYKAAISSDIVVGDTVTFTGAVGIYNELQLRNSDASTIVATTKVVRTVAMAIDALGAQYTGKLTDGAELTNTVTVGGVDFAVAWVVKSPTEGGAVAITEGKLALTKQDAAVEFVLTATVTPTEGEAGTVDLSGTVPAKPAAGSTTVTFTFGEDGAASHKDGDSIGAGKSYTSGSYTLELTGASNVYGGASDATGKSCLKVGTSSKTGGFTITVPDDVTSVTFYVAKYKANNTTVEINGTEKVIEKNSNDGEYTAITIDTSTTKTITFSTVSGKYRCMIDKIVWNVVPTEEPTA